MPSITQQDYINIPLTLGDSGAPIVPDEWKDKIIELIATGRINDVVFRLQEEDEDAIALLRPVTSAILSDGTPNVFVIYDDSIRDVCNEEQPN